MPHIFDLFETRLSQITDEYAEAHGRFPSLQITFSRAAWNQIQSDTYCMAFIMEDGCMKYGEYVPVKITYSKQLFFIIQILP